MKASAPTLARLGLRALAAAVLPVALGAPGGDLVAARAIAATAPPRIEHFVLESPGGPGGRPRIVGAVEWRRQDFRDGAQLEVESRLGEAGSFGASAGGEVRVLHVERLTAEDARLVWREIGEQSGRSLLAEWTSDAHGLRTLEWGRDGARRGTLEGWNGAVMPLYLVELARAGRALEGSHVVFDPLGRSLETLTLKTTYELDRVQPLALSALPDAIAARPTDAPGAAEAAPVGGGPARTVALVRKDGTSAGRFVFRGCELVAFEWQAGGPSARRVTAEEHARALETLAGAQPSRPAAHGP